MHNFVQAGAKSLSLPFPILFRKPQDSSQSPHGPLKKHADEAVTFRSESMRTHHPSTKHQLALPDGLLKHYSTGVRKAPL